MNKLNLVVVAALIGVCLVSCKEDNRVMAYHVFWFNEATSDSLKANGINQLEFESQDYTFEMGETTGIYHPDNWNASEPVEWFDLANKVGIYIPEGDTVTMNYRFIATHDDGSESYLSTSHVPKAEGSIQFIGKTAGKTELVWY